MMNKPTKSFWVGAICLAVVLVLAIILTVVGMTIAGNRGVMTLHSNTVDKQLYAYWQARFRYEYLIYYAEDGATDTEQFWNKVKDEKIGTTYGEDCQTITDNLIERIVISAYLFDLSGNTLSDSYREKIKLVTEERVNVGVFKGKKDYNEKASFFGFDWDTYVEAMIYEVKADLLASMFVPTEEMQHAFYEEEYVRVKMVFVSAEQLQSADTVTLIRSALENGADATQFDRWVTDPTYNSDTGSTLYTEGYYFSKTSAFAEEYFTYRPTVKNAIFGLATSGDWCEVTLTKEGDKGTLFIYRYDKPETPAYKTNTNSDFFTDLTRDAADEYFTSWVNSYREDVVWYAERKETIPAAGYGGEVGLYMFFS